MESSGNWSKDSLLPFEVLRETVHDPIQKPIHGIVAVAMEEAERAEEALKILTGTEKR